MLKTNTTFSKLKKNKVAYLFKFLRFPPDGLQPKKKYLLSFAFLEIFAFFFSCEAKYRLCTFSHQVWSPFSRASSHSSQKSQNSPFRTPARAIDSPITAWVFSNEATDSPAKHTCGLLWIDWELSNLAFKGLPNGFSAESHDNESVTSIAVVTGHCWMLMFVVIWLKYWDLWTI